MSDCQVNTLAYFGGLSARVAPGGGRLVMTCLGCFFCALVLGRPCAAHSSPAPSDPALDALTNDASSAVVVALTSLAFFFGLRGLVALYEGRRRREFDPAAAKAGTFLATAGVALLLWRLTGPAAVPPAVVAYVDTPQHGGQILASGDNHLELAVRPDDSVALYLMGVAETLPYPITDKTLRARARASGVASTPLTLRAAPQPGDPAGQASAFTGQLPPGLTASRLSLEVSVPLAGVVRQIRFGGGSAPTHDTAATLVVATPVTAAERALFLTPGGGYTAADIAANGGQTPSQKFQGLMANHHLHPARGAYACPITRTQADKKFAWVVGGRKYLFCCPPCVTEFVKKAKAHPDSLRAPQSYVQG